MFVRDRMNSPAVTFTPDTPLQDALDLMYKHRFWRLPVIDGEGNPRRHCVRARSSVCFTPTSHVARWFGAEPPAR